MRTNKGRSAGRATHKTKLVSRQPQREMRAMSREDKAMLKKSPLLKKALKLLDLQLDVQECDALQAMLKCVVAQGGKLIRGDPFPELEKKAEKARKRLAHYEKTLTFKKPLTKGS